MEEWMIGNVLLRAAEHCAATSVDDKEGSSSILPRFVCGPPPKPGSPANPLALLDDADTPLPPTLWTALSLAEANPARERVVVEEGGSKAGAGNEQGTTRSARAPHAHPYVFSSWPLHIRKRTYHLRVPRRGPHFKMGQCIVYWANACPRVHCNYALELSLMLSAQLRLPLLVIGVVLATIEPDRQKCVVHGSRSIAARYAAMVSFQTRLRQKHNLEMPIIGTMDVVSTVISVCRNPGFAASEGTALHAHALICDDDFTMRSQAWLKAVAARIPGAMFAVDSNHTSPIRYLSPGEYVEPYTDVPPPQRSLPGAVRDRYDCRSWVGEVLRHEVIRMAKTDEHSVEALLLCCLDQKLVGLNVDELGEIAALATLSELRNSLQRWSAEELLKPWRCGVSGLLVYVETGSLSSIHIMQSLGSCGEAGRLDAVVGRGRDRMVWQSHTLSIPNSARGLEQLIPEWVKQELARHNRDPRDSEWGKQELEDCCSEDHVWNSLQQLLLRWGMIHVDLLAVWGQAVLLHWPLNDRNDPIQWIVRELQSNCVIGGGAMFIPLLAHLMFAMPLVPGRVHRSGRSLPYPPAPLAAIDPARHRRAVLGLVPPAPATQVLDRFPASAVAELRSLSTATHLL